MRFRVPLFFPPYAVLILVITYAIGSLWLGLERLNTITHLTEAAAQNAKTTNDLRDLLAAVNDIETAGRGYALTADETYLEPFERGRRRVPVLLSALRDEMRDDKVELALIEDLVSLIAERQTITIAGIERKRNAPDKPYEMSFGRRGKQSSEEIRSIVATLDSREQDELAQVRRTLAKTLGDARRDLFVMAGVTLLLVISLFVAVRRLRSFIVVPHVASGGKVAVAASPSPAARDAEVGTLLRDALLRARLGEASAPADAGTGEHRRSLVQALEHALTTHSSASENDPAQAEQQSVAESLRDLGRAYSVPDGLTIKATIDQKVRISDAQKAFLVLRSAEWALEAITLRKRTGEVTLSLTTRGNVISLHIMALTDNPGLPVTLAPKEAEEADALRNGALAVAGAFVVDEGPMGFSLTLTVPGDR